MIRRLLVALALLLLPTQAMAWWEFGHETVARIAYLNVSPATRAEIDRLLRQSRLLETPTCGANTIELASYWPDCIKNLGERFSYASPWHYQNVNICQAFDENAACPDGNCVSRQIERQLRLLADVRVPIRERLMALAFLVHLMGDLHQPMHAGDHNDLGGNRVPVDYGIISGRTNLHLVWDGYLAERGISQPEGDARGILAELSEADRAAMRQGDITAWLREGWAASREFAYGTIRADPCVASPDTRPVVTEEIVRRLIPVVRRQVARGGLRLARLLDEAFRPDSPWSRPPERRRS
ncbi:MAG: S1/P1 nuclease [Sphingosinicella sp.]|uniref:S1/P1 nuclease n=1 Tax=Sphingosinicella sp. TaxID=1917971 RepID=UPI004037BCDA